MVKRKARRSVVRAYVQAAEVAVERTSPRPRGRHVRRRGKPQFHTKTKVRRPRSKPLCVEFLPARRYQPARRCYASD